MHDEETRGKLATLVVEALEVGTGKNERDVIDDLFSAFGIAFTTLDRSVPLQTKDRATVLRKAAAEQLAAAAPTAGALLNEVVRCGGRFVAMVDEIYRHLARHSATTTGTNDTFRLQRADVDEEQLVISPEFVELIRKHERRLTNFEIGRIDHAALQSFVGCDNGEFYGTWPPRPENGIRLLDDLLALAQIGPEIAKRVAGSAAWESSAAALATATAAGERLVTVAQWLIRAHMIHLDALPGDTLDDVRELFTGELPGWVHERIRREFESYRTKRVLTTMAAPGAVINLEGCVSLGLDENLQPVVVPEPIWSETAVGSLAGFVAQWRRGQWSPRSHRRREREQLADPAALTRRLTTLANASQEAADWLATEVFHPIGSVEITDLLESIEEFLNLPLWRQRRLLYEIWVLCTTIDVCEQGGWVPHLVGAPGPDGVWVLSDGVADVPACRLEHAEDPDIALNVWHEPRCATADGELTPDVTVSTPPPHSRELVVVEAKDQVKMARGRPGSTGALAVADRYAAGLRPEVTWVVNHCDYRQGCDPEAEYGNSWARIRLAEQFRPGNVPPAFADTVRAATTPPGAAKQQTAANGLVLVVDRTRSMAGRIAEARLELLNGVLDAAYDEFRVIAYTDHNTGESFLVRSLGPFPNLADALAAAEELPEANGGDIEEALEDALQRCVELVSDLGPRTFLILTDAPAHSVESCPYGIDAREEAQALLDHGCLGFVADDWLEPPYSRSIKNTQTPGFAFLPLTAIASAGSPAVTLQPTDVQVRSPGRSSP
ncbi:hypothetical protein ABT256_21855 [Amycolatopsis japonica]|uniref:hypothetical protein n=1 Tax=Amycolatopsis japonica TaxID=208439 RepID=UPI003318A902